MHTTRLFLFILILQAQFVTAQSDTTLVFKARKEVPPKFPGGDSAMVKFIENNLIYPKKAFENGNEGMVIISFVIETDGSVTNAEIKKSAGTLFDAEALRLVNLMPQWEPGTWDGKPVKVIFNMPLKFYVESTFKRDNPNLDTLDTENKSQNRVGFSLLAAYTPLFGEISDYASGIGGFDVELHLLLNKFYVDFGVMLDQFSKTKKEFEANGHWRKGRAVAVSVIYLAAGYNFSKNKRWKIVPYVGGSYNSLLPSKSESSDPEDGFRLSTTAGEGGVIVDRHFGLRKYGPRSFTNQFLRFKTGYKYFKFNDFLKQ